MLLKGLFFSYILFSQSTDSSSLTQKATVKGLSFGLHYGSVFAHSEEVQNTAGANPVGFEFAYTFQRRDKEVVDLCNCYPRKGIVASYFNFDNEILGRGLMAGWMLEPTYRLGEKLQLGIRGIAGLAWMSNPFDSVKNPGNQSYSTAISAWLVVGVNLSYPLSDKWRLQIGGNFEHTSNGGMRQPNKGVNFPTASMHFQYTPNPKPYYRGTRNNEKYWIGQPWRKDIALFGTAKRNVGAGGIGTREPVVGLMGLGSKQVGHINALTVGMEGYFDGFLSKELEADSIEATSAIRIGLMGGHEFLLGKFNFSQQLGVYLYNPSGFDGAWFHRWGVMYKLGKSLSVGLNLKAHKHVADFIDARLVYSW
jgi:hypothetical protein